MKNFRSISPLLVLVLSGSVALAQAGNPDLPDAPQPQTSASVQSEATPDAHAETSGRNSVNGQGRRYPRFPRRPIRAFHGAGYRSAAPMPGLSPVGALIGFGVGAGLGASGSQDRSAGARVVSGLIVGAIGAVIGGAIGTFPSVRRGYPPREPDDDDDDDSDLRSDARTGHRGRLVPPKIAAPSQSPTVQTATPLSEAVAAPSL